MPDMREFNFKPGDEIEFCGDRFIVKQNDGWGGIVHEIGFPEQNLRFAWNLGGSKCKLVKRAEEKS